MPQLEVPPPPNTTPVFPDIRPSDIRSMLQNFTTKIIRFISADVWARWFTLLQQKVNPIVAKATLSFPSTAAQTSSDLQVTVKGAATDLKVEIIPPVASIFPNSHYEAFVIASDTVLARFCNWSAGAQQPSSGVFTFIVRP